jgi:hypothetical protein
MGHPLTDPSMHEVPGLCMFVLMSVHLGLHWSALSRLASLLGRSRPGPERKAGLARKAAAIIAGILVSAYGIYASFTHELGAKLVMYYGYSFWDPARPKFIFFIDFLAIMGLYICVTRCALAFIQAAQGRNGRNYTTTSKSRQ